MKAVAIISCYVVSCGWRYTGLRRPARRCPRFPVNQIIYAAGEKISAGGAWEPKPGQSDFLT
jgi:hypothetical protein